MVRKIALFIMIGIVLPATAITDETYSTPQATISANNHLQQLCRNLAHCCKNEQASQELHALLDASNQEVDCDALLRALEQCVASECDAQTEQEQDNLLLLEKNYQLLADVHAQLLEQLGTRTRIKIKFFAKLYADELVVTNNMIVNGTLVVRDCLRMPSESRELILANNGGCVIGETITEVEIPNGSITTADLADGSVTTPKFANGAVTADKISTGTINPSNFSFKVLQTSNAETTPLKVVRGYVTISAGVVTIQSGEGFTVNRFSAGNYQVTFASPYSSTTSYSAFVRPFYVGPANNGGYYDVIPSVSDSSRFGLLFYNSTGTPPNYADPAGFEFFTIGT